MISEQPGRVFAVVVLSPLLVSLGILLNQDATKHKAVATFLVLFGFAASLTPLIHDSSGVWEMLGSTVSLSVP